MAEAAVEAVPETAAAGAEAVQVQETEDAWLIPGSVVAVAGVFNRKLRTFEELAKTAELWNGVPLIHVHPDGAVVGGKDLRVVGGRLEAVQADAKAKEGRGGLVGTYRLLKRAIPGFRVTDEAVRLNAAAVELLRKGKPLGNSVGYLHDVVAEAGRIDGQEYTVRAVNIVPNHLALYGALGRAEDVACPPPVCGAGAAQGESVAYAHSHSTSPATQSSMPECGQECKDRHVAATERATKLATTLAMLAEAVGLAREAKEADVLDRVRKAVADEKAAREELTPLKQAESRRHARSLKAVIDAEAPVALEVAGKEAKEADVRKGLEEEFKAWSSEQLDRHLASLQVRDLRTVQVIPGKGMRDALRVGGTGREDQLGVATTGKLWPRKEA